jgi:hypothetical protein
MTNLQYVKVIFHIGLPEKCVYVEMEMPIFRDNKSHYILSRYFRRKVEKILSEGLL